LSFGGILVFGGHIVTSYTVSKIFTNAKNKTLNKTRFTWSGFGVYSACSSSHVTSHITPVCYSSKVKKAREAQTKPSPSIDDCFAENQRQRKRKKLLKRRNCY
jgi:hypothetical protein